MAPDDTYPSTGQDTKIVDLSYTRRTLNILERTEGLDRSRNTLKDMEGISLGELAGQRNVGKRTMFEIGGTLPLYRYQVVAIVLTGNF